VHEICSNGAYGLCENWKEGRVAGIERDASKMLMILMTHNRQREIHN
jgi:hypothetical protein